MIGKFVAANKSESRVCSKCIDDQINDGCKRKLSSDVSEIELLPITRTKIFFKNNRLPLYHLILQTLLK